MNAAQAMQRAREVIRRQHKSLATEQAYLHWLGRYIRALLHYPAALSSEAKLERFLSDLARHRNVSASTQNQAFNAILFFYRDVLKIELGDVQSLRATRPAHLRHAPTMDETRALLQAVRDVGGYPVNLIVRLLYGCGLRVTEPLNLRIKDVDLANGKLFILGAKGGQDRVVALPCSVAPELRSQMDYARAVWERDGRARIPVELPHQLARKYPEYQFAWPWAWLFPQRHPCRHPRTGQIVRYRMHEANVQQGVKEARQRLGVMILPHELRHAYATHSLGSGANPRAIQAAMGHKSLETTMGYLHAEALSVASPLDSCALPTRPLAHSPAH
jgi:integron integrase